MTHLSCGNRPLARCPNQPWCGGTGFWPIERGCAGAPHDDSAMVHLKMEESGVGWPNGNASAMNAVIRAKTPIHKISEEPDVDGLRPLAALDHIDGYSLAFQQIGEAATTERRGMHKNVSATA